MMFIVYHALVWRAPKWGCLAWVYPTPTYREHMHAVFLTILYCWLGFFLLCFFFFFFFCIVGWINSSNSSFLIMEALIDISFLIDLFLTKQSWPKLNPKFIYRGNKITKTKSRFEDPTLVRSMSTFKSLTNKQGHLQGFLNYMAMACVKWEDRLSENTLILFII